MGYSKTSKYAITKVQTLLDQMLKSEGNVSWPSRDPQKLIYLLRDALSVAEKDHSSPYRPLKSNFIIRNKGTHVLAERRNVVDIIGELSRSRMTIENITTLIEIIGAVITHKQHEMYFPDALVNEEEILQLYNWCLEKEYNIVVGDGITVTKNDPGEAKWLP